MIQMNPLTHFNAAGQAHMVDVGDKPETRRVAVATGHITMLPATFALLQGGNAKKGDVIGIARLAAATETLQHEAQPERALQLDHDRRLHRQRHLYRWQWCYDVPTWHFAIG